LSARGTGTGDCSRLKPMRLYGPDGEQRQNWRLAGHRSWRCGVGWLDGMEVEPLTHGNRRWSLHHAELMARLRWSRWQRKKETVALLVLAPGKTRLMVLAACSTGAKVHGIAGSDAGRGRGGSGSARGRQCVGRWPRRSAARAVAAAPRDLSKGGEATWPRSARFDSARTERPTR
jgi:hypothetical protein